MTINPLSANLINLISNEAVSIDSNRVGLGQSDSSFASVLTDSFETAIQADVADKASTLELMTGQNDDLTGLMLDLQKAELSLSLALQIRNKIVDSYNEIMRMQV